MMMEELPATAYNRKTSDDYLEHTPVLNRNNYSFLEFERELMQTPNSILMSQPLPPYVETIQPQFNMNQATFPQAITKIRQAQDEIFSHDGERGGKVPIHVSEGRPSCNCTKSQCLKLYCMCFRKGYPCNEKCKCHQCMNTVKNHELANLRRTQKIMRQTETETIFCNCRMSFCEKSYCACARNGLGCSKLCKCFNCKNPNGCTKH